MVVSLARAFATKLSRPAFYGDGDAPVGGADTGGSPSSAPSSSSPPSTPIGGSPSTPIGGSPSTPIGGSPQTPAPTPFSVREFLGQQGLDASRFTDDRQTTEYLVNAYRQAQQYREQVQQMQGLAQLGQRYQQHAPQIDQFLQTLQQPAKPQAPEWNPAWRNMVRRGADGELIAPPGMGPDFMQKYNNAINHQLSTLDKLAFEGPKAVFGDDLKSMIREEAQALVQQHLGQYRDQTFAQQTVNQHGDWLYQKDAQGNILTDPLTGQRAMTQEGRAYGQYVRDLESSGIRDLAKQDYMARRLVAADLAIAKALGGQQSQQQLSPQQINEQLKQQALNGANRAPNYGGTNLPPTNPNNGVVPQNQAGAVNLRQMLAQRFQQQGITDQDFLNL